MVMQVGKVRAVRGVMPRTREELRGWLRAVMGVEVSCGGLVAGHGGPLDYLCHAFFEGGDCVVWANRGGGKTFYAAVATALDLIFKPGIEVVILGGSLEQAGRMHEHLRGLFARPGLSEMVEGRATERRLVLKNGSRARVLAQSMTSVRGVRAQRIRCDEVELFDAEVWRAAQLCVRSARCGGVEVRASVEALSTWHRPGGLMESLVGSCEESASVRRLFRWGVVDVLEKCPEARACAGCGLWDECGGRAKEGSGHVRIDDALVMKGRADTASWESEMLCLRPRRSGAVFPEFEVGRHVAEFEVDEAMRKDGLWVGGMDFGYRNPAVVLWGVVDEEGWLRIVDERVVREATLDAHVEAIRGSAWGALRWIGVDPAGRSRSDQTGLSAVSVLRRAGLRVRSRRCGLYEGIQAVRRRLAPAGDGPGLLVHARCAELVRALSSYRYGDGASSGPVKDGHDHCADALRYLVVNLDGDWDAWRGRYM